MPGTNQQHNPPLPIRDEFRSLLKSEWTRHVACQNECPPKSCSCQRKIVHVHAVEAWWKKQASESLNNTKLDRFVHEMPILPNRSLPVKPTRIVGGGQSCLRILSLLLRQDREHLIGHFYEASMYDDYLARNESDQNLREQLAGVLHHEEAEAIIGDFHKEKWEFCPLALTLDMDKNLHGTKVIPPFCSKIKLPDKGGTASIYWVAVQKDLVSDNALALALQDSVYTDKDFGECYQMVLKSYCGNKKRDFELEKEAFSGLQSNDQVPILQYLGSYTHDYGEGKDLGKTYNLLLEYGENDLFQAWADETNVPPVQAQEILQNWNSLFNVANAIQHVHDFEIQRGRNRPWRFRGWHADIKPDNILSVRGRLKLADFGFSSFAPVIDNHDSSEPTEFIRGFTDTYGAPEVFRMKQPDGTLSGVSRSIDAWSFSCVLSVAATWIVLGFQGLRQYERLRQLSPANNKDGLMFDRFHDGCDVLPEIGKWHGYLRGHLRPSDTTTELVLDLIENKLLRADPSARYNLEELCEKLQELSSWAEYKIKSLKKNSGDTDPIVMKALKDIEEQAQTQGVSEPKINLLKQPLLQVNPRERASMQINKEKMIRNKPLGQTTHRKEILEKKLEDCDVMKMDDKPLASGVHNGAVTHSPTESTPAKGLPFGGRRIKPKNPGLRTSDHSQSSEDRRTPNNTRNRVNPSPPFTPPPSDPQRRIFGVGAGIYGDDPFTTNSHATSGGIDPRTNPSSGRPNLHLSTTNSPLEKHATKGVQPNGALKLLSPSQEKEFIIQDASLAPASLYTTGTEVYSTKYPNKPNESAIGHGAGNHSLTLATHPHFRRSQESPDDAVPNTRSFDPPPDEERVNEPFVDAFRTSSQTTAVGSAGPLINVSNPEGGQSPHGQLTPYLTPHVYEKPAVEKEPNLHTRPSSNSNESFPKPLPPSALQLPFDICLRRRDMDEQVLKGFTKGLAKVRGSFGIETRARDSRLIETFNDQRELIFVVDNGWTMSTHWPIVTFVAQTLAKNAAGLDKDGIDLKFTVDGHRLDEQRLRGDSGRKKLKKALRAAGPENKANNHATTNMARVFEDIFVEWGRNGQPAMTLFVFTDGVWSNTNPDDLDRAILDIARKDGMHAGNRHFSIQFIRFGNEDLERARLQWLDDVLCARHNLRDIIDHCSWRAKVDKMFKGSIEGYADEQDSDEEPLYYDYKKLVNLFNTFNTGEDALSPTTSLFRSPSRVSNRSSISMPQSGDFTRRC